MKNLYGALLLGLVACGAPEQPAEDRLHAVADHQAAIPRWVDEEFSPSSLQREAQIAELTWFSEAAKPFRGMAVNVVSETLTTHEYESEILAQAFYEITGIKVTHDLIQEGDVIEKLQTQMQSGENVYDAMLYHMKHCVDSGDLTSWDFHVIDDCAELPSDGVLTDE